MEPIFVTRQSGVRLLNVVLLVVGAGVVVACLGIVLIEPDAWFAALATLISMLVLLVFIWNILPARYEIFSDRLVLVFPFYRWNIALADISSERPVKWWESYAYWGFRFVTNPSKAVAILRRQPGLFGKGWVISPEDKEGFVAALDSALKRSGDR